jgi:hypothetical protein
VQGHRDAWGAITKGDQINTVVTIDGSVNQCRTDVDGKDGGHKTR